MYSSSATQGDQTDGTFNGAKIYFCHTSRSTLSATFDDNYDGNTPTLMLSRSALTLNWTKSAWNEIALDDTFVYNGSDNLLIEIQWTSSSDSLLAAASSTADNCRLGTFGSSTGSDYYRCNLQLHDTPPTAPLFYRQQTDVSCGDGLIDPGESIDVACLLRNFGTTATNAQATLSTTSSWCTVTQANWSLGTMAQDASASNNASPFSVDVSASAPAGALLPLQLDVTANGGSFTQSLPVNIYVAEPDFSLSTFLVNDFSGNTNLALNPDERAYITIVITNNGAAASNITAALSCANPRVTVVSPSSAIDNIPKLTSGNNIDSPFCIQMASNAWDNGLYEFTVDLSYNSGSSDSLTFEVCSDYADPIVGSSSWLSTTGGITYTAALIANGYNWINLPFDFPFYGSEYRNSVLLTKHGHIVLDEPWVISSGNSSIPNSSGINCFVAPYWDNLDPNTGFVRSKLYGSSPDRIFVMEWNGLTRALDAGSSVTFQALLHESGKIQYQYGSCSGGSYPNGASATIGIENADGTAGVQHSYNQAAAISDGTCLTFDRAKPPTDSDVDGIPDACELFYWGAITNSNGTGDTDGDGLSDLQELLNFVNPTVGDTDGDGFSDGAEVTNDTDPLNPLEYPGSGPLWWATHSVINTNLTVNDYAAANQGQLKWIALQAYSTMTGEYGQVSESISNVINSFKSTNNYQAVNLGQLKCTAEPFYLYLSNSVPWTGTNANDFAPANIGQIKNAFNFGIP